MKSKKITKKLKLNKKTVADLNHGELKNAHGGEHKSTQLSNCLLCTDTCAASCPNTCAASCPMTAEFFYCCDH